jgi:flagellin
MALTLNTNIDSLTAQNNLSGSQGLLSQSLTRLSSGLRINSAADDAAGLAISQQFTTQVNGTNQAINNANNAISEAQTAGGALSTIVNNLQSIRTLAVEAANGSNSASDRAALDQQVQAQIAEITRVSAQTSFNGSAVLSGGAGITTYQVGANVGDTIAVDLAQGVGANQIGQVASSTTEVTAALTGNLSLQVGSGAAVTIGSSATYATTVQTAGTNGVQYQNSSSAYAAAATINAAQVSGLTATADNVQDVTFTAITSATAAYSLWVNGVTVDATAVGGSVTAANLITAINNFSTQDGGVTAAAGGAAPGNILLTAADGSNITIQQNDTGDTGLGVTSAIGYNPSTVNTTAGTVGADIATATATALTNGQSSSTLGQVTLSAGDTNITVGGSDAANIGITTAVIAATGTLANNNVLTVAGANSTIEAVDSALSTVSQFQSQLGAIQNRFTSAVQNLTTTAQNLTQSRSTLEDANFAQETANLTQAQVLEQAGISVLSQANQEPQLNLKLLQ